MISEKAIAAGISAVIAEVDYDLWKEIYLGGDEDGTQPADLRRVFVNAALEAEDQ